MAARKYVCIQPCFHLGHRFYLGDVVEVEASWLPKRKKGEVTEIAHFQLLEEREVPEAPGTEVKVNDKKRAVKQTAS